ncbi:UNVERIFIED_CONTAM: hypothetical protein K2H54_039858 [Gekko kuhli]
MGPALEDSVTQHVTAPRSGASVPESGPAWRPDQLGGGGVPLGGLPASLRERPKGGRSCSGVQQAAGDRAVAERFISARSSSGREEKKRIGAGAGALCLLGAS